MNIFYSRHEILNQLNECAGSFTFPILDNGYVYLGDARLSAYRDQVRWALVMEILGYNVRVGGYDGLSNCLHCFGNCLNRPPGTANEDFLSVTGDGPDAPTFDDEYGWYVRERTQSLCIRGVIVPLRLRPEQLEAKGIQLVEEPRLTGVEVMRSLIPEYREQLLATEGELRARIPPDLPLILRLDEWHHPDLAADELPSQSETFQMIAEVLETGDKSRYVPGKKPNTHWTNWPGGGTL